MASSAPKPSVGLEVSPMHHVFGGALGAFFTLKDYQNQVAEGKNPYRAAAGAALNNLPFLITQNILGQFALSAAFPIAKGIVSSTYSSISKMNSWRLSALQPFSHRFEHSDAAMMSMQLGMQAIGASRGAFGMEASMMHSRYGRR